MSQNMINFVYLPLLLGIYWIQNEDTRHEKDNALIYYHRNL